MNLSLQNKTAVVCGSTQGIGKAAALELASLGARIVLVARDREKLKSALAELPTTAAHLFIVADFNFPEKLKEEITKFSAVQAAHILINNTGGPSGGPILEASTEEFAKALAAHLTCNHILAQALAPAMKREGYGRIINIISTSVKAPIVGLGVSNTVRAAVAGWAKTLSHELAPFGITVNNILPGATNTERLKSLQKFRAEKARISFEEEKNNWLKDIPAGRFADASEIAAAIAFLASPAASYINGINLPVDGGRTMSL
ncbi:MAG: short-chain dehydrogenase [Candidatus Nephrothrix sp. EaCA]|nr:MAG: short-chain dehydrogenase [Candidatus Nephrothrix sp. EaCA]